MDFPVSELTNAEFPPLLREIPDPPEALNYRGQLPLPAMKLLAVVGSRKYSSYGQQVVEHLINGLKGYPVGIVSGLALGIDSLAHKAALQNNLYTLAVPGSGINDEVIYPASHKCLAREILAAGGGLLSEFAPDLVAAKWTFPARNRIMAGLSHATLLIEAAERSGTLITARLTTDYNRDLLVVPGSIFSSNSRGVHQFLKLGATPVTDASDILEVLEIKPVAIQPAATSSAALSEIEQKIISTLFQPLDIDTIIRQSDLSASEVNTLLMQLEIKGCVKNLNGRYQAVV